MVTFDASFDNDLTPLQVIRFYAEQAQDLIKFSYSDVSGVRIEKLRNNRFKMTLWYDRERSDEDVAIMAGDFVDPDDDGNDPVVDDEGEESLVSGYVVSVVKQD